ncbi:midasin isoform X2 [Takifugu rubripes]|uniref:midasin isoform X2 n=1 Tax=Takifugu rubripes TaxID=31033 RepID=UPI0011458B3F|nr:midasin isoform X2 [Takifugu rubripes]
MTNDTMENLELSLSSLGILSKHVDKNHNHLAQYLSKQVWNQQDRQCVLGALAQLLLEKDYTLLIARHLRPFILDLLERNAERVKAGGRVSHDLHERLCVAVSKLLNISPDAKMFAARYFSHSPPVFQRLFFTTEESSAVQYGPRRMKLRDLMAATLRFLHNDCATYRVLWDWSPCVSQLLTSDIMVRGYTAHCLALVSHMTDNQKTIFLRKVLTSDEILHMKMMALEELQQLEVEKALVLTNQGSVTSRLEKTEKFTRGQVVSADLSQNVVAVCSVLLPRVLPRQAEQTNPKDLVLVDSTCHNLRRLALALASHKPVLLEGPIGCGKTSLVQFLAAATGHVKSREILKVQLGDQTDSKMLLGMYRCTDIPGKFVWQPGTLTQAVTKGQWILLEDIDHAPLDVISVLLPLMENKKLMIPGREECVDVTPGFQFFATRRMYYSSGTWNRPPNSHAVLLDKYWIKLQMGTMSREELKKVLINKYPQLTVVSDRLLDIYCQLTGQQHSDGDTTDLLTHDGSQQTNNQQNKSEERSTPMEGRALSLRDLLKWCDRISVNFDGTSSATAQHVFHEALDCFTAMLSRPESRVQMAETIGSKLNISREQAQHFCQMYLPGITRSESEVSVGRISLGRKQAESVHLSVDSQTFAATRPSAVLLEQLAVCVNRGEPVLLVGETGTGKTSTVQYLAKLTGHRLRVVNMNQQSDTADLLGGYKPVDQKQILLPLLEAFEELFSQTYSRKQNLTFLGHVQTCFRGKRWHDLLKLMDHVCKSALAKELQEKTNAALLQERWEMLLVKLRQTQQQIRACETAMVFAFVEGTLVQAVKKGHWILLDEINLAAAETLECLSGLLEGSAGSLVLLDRGDTEPLVRHPDFRLFACMNPATDVGKRNLPLGLRNRFTELYVDELENEGDLRVLVSDYLKGLTLQRSVISGIISFYLAVRKQAREHLVDGTGHRPHYSLRTLCRALTYVGSNPCNSVQRSLYEGFCMSFLTQLDRSSHPLVQKLVCQHILMGNTKCLKRPIPAPSGHTCVEVQGYWVPQGEAEPALDPSYVLTTSVKLNLRDLARVVSAGCHPVLIQGETSVGKTSLIQWLASATGNHCVRINNHEHTDIQEYIGCYSSDNRGKLIFKEGVLINAMRRGYWIILDELNLAPTDVLEALNRLLDDNRELFVAETQEVIKAHPGFMLFATQNPPGLYGGRKVLSRAFRNRFVELHFDELPSKELENILHQRCSLPPSYCTKLVNVMEDLQAFRRGSSVFAGKHGFITLRDLFRWADRYRLEEQEGASQDWLQHLADDGYMLLAGRVRKQEEEAIVLAILEKHFKRKVNTEELFSQQHVASQFSPSVDSIAGVPEEFRHVVWTYGMRRLAVLVGRALRFGESVLLVGETGCGKTTICQMFAALAGLKYFSVNCHLHLETSDFLGGLRPVRHTRQTEDEDGKLFRWHDGPLVQAMKEGGVFLMDEISLADDSVLERLNSVLETQRSLVLVEKGSGDTEDVELITAAPAFRLVATMNPGGDFGKKELSPALRNRFTEIWCPQSNSRSDLVRIVQHNLRSGLILDGGDIAEVMLDFIEWLTQQDFGRHCILSVRDILSWVSFLNTVCERDEDGFMTMGVLEDEEEAEWDLRLDTVTAFIHAACLVYIDALGSGPTVSCSDGAFRARRLCLAFLQQRLSKMTTLDQEILEALRVYDCSLSREPQWGEDFFGIDPFYIALGPQAESRSLSDYAMAAGTTAMNAQRLLRALKLQKPVLLEGSPGVGKTSLVAALAKACGNPLVRINLSEQTDITDLFGTDLPVEGGKGGEFAWRDGPLLAALKAGHWVVLDELNLASQSVLEGLNACFDHRAEIYIPELGMSFHVQHEKTKIFACQNPFTQGGGRKGLPKSFLNRFTQVFVDQLTCTDIEFIGDSMFPSIDKEIISKMVAFNNTLVQEVSVERRWGQKGGPWEFNLRDMFRWCELMQADQSPGFYNPGQHVALVYADRMRTETDKLQVLSVFRKVFGEDFEPYNGSRQFHMTPLNLQVGFSVLPRSGGAPVALDPPLSITHQALHPLESLMKCVERGWMTILVGPTASGKTSLVRLLALLTGHRLRVMAMNSSMDTTELLGGFEQVDIMRPWQQVLESVDYIVAMVIRRGLMSLEVGIQDTEFLLQTWGLFCHWLKEERLQRSGGSVNSEALNKLEVIILLLQKLNTKLKVFTDMSKLQMDFTLLKERLAQLEDGWTNGGFEWLDGMLVQALQTGDWLLMDNANFCSASVLDRLNALLEPGGSLTINERGVIDGKTPQMVPHPNFRLFLTMDEVHGELSRAMRNRGLEIYIPGEREDVSWDTMDLKTLLHTAGVTGDCVCDLLIEIHKSIKSTIWDSPASSVVSLLNAATILSCQLRRGVDLPSALQQACGDTYAMCQRNAAKQKEAQQIIEQHLAVLDTDDWGSGLLCAGVWPDGFPSALLSTEDSCFSSVLRDGQILSFCLNTLSLQGKRNRPLSLSDLKRVLQSSGLPEGRVFCDGIVDLEDGDALRLIPTAVRLLTERASHGDWSLRSSWLSHLGKGYQNIPDLVLVQMEAGNRALNAVFASKLAAKGKSLAELLQPHSIDEYRILVDMRWNKQYLDILASKCNFEDEERYMDFLEALNTVANRIVLLMDREERSVICTYSANLSPQSSALGTATAFNKGTVDVSHLAHPVLVHLRSFFDLWESFTLQALQNGQPCISDHIMFEILQLLQWLDHFWDACSTLPADSQSISILSLHWQWVHKHLITRLPQLLLGDTDTSSEGHRELQAVSAAIQALLSPPASVAAALKGIQKTLGKALPFKLLTVADCASRLRRLSKALDVNDLRLEDTTASMSQELVRLHVVGLGLDIKESLLEACGLVLLANTLLDPHSSGVLDRLVSSVEQQQREMTCRGLLDVGSHPEDQELGVRVQLSRQELQQLRHRVQLWPLMEELAVLNQLRLSNDLLHLAFSPGDRKAEDSLRRELSRHLRYCLQSTPINLSHLQPLWFLLSSDKPAEELQFVWCELLSQALAAIWSSSAAADPNPWLKWDPQRLTEQPSSRKHHGKIENRGPAMLTKAVWSRCILGVLGSSESVTGWAPSGEALLSHSYITLGEWTDRIQQLQDLSAVLWDNMGMSSLAEFRLTDFRLQGSVLRRQLQSLADLLPPSLQEGYMESCESLVEDPDPLIAAQEIQTVLREFVPPNILPEGLIEVCIKCLEQYVQNKVQGSEQLACSGVFWVNMGLLQIKVWTPQTIFDPAMKRSYKLIYAQQELSLLQEEWRSRSLSSQMMTGAELAESSITDGFQHPRIRYLWIRMQQLKEQIAELSRKQACRPTEPHYGRLFQELQHYLCSIGQKSSIDNLLSHLLKALHSSSSYSSKSRSKVHGLLKEVTVWQNSQQHFCQKLVEDYPMYPDVVGPIQTGILQLRYGMSLVASQLATSLTPVPGLRSLVSCLLAFPTLSHSLPSYLARADFLCSQSCTDILHVLDKLLPQQDSVHVVPQPLQLRLNALLYVQCHALCTGELRQETGNLFRNICQAVVKEWDELEQRRREQEQLEASLYRSRSRHHGSGLTEDEQEEREFRSHFPQFNQDFADIESQPCLEGPSGSTLEREENHVQEEASRSAGLSPETINTLVKVHQHLCLGYARSLWYQRTAPANNSNVVITTLVSSYQIASPLMSTFYHVIDAEVDHMLTGSGLLLSALLQNTVQGSGAPGDLAIASEGPYDFYHQPNMREARLCLSVLEKLDAAVKQRLQDWPDHPALVQLTVVIERIMAFSLASPLAKFLNGLEILLSKAQDWENNASRSVSLGMELEEVTQFIIQWRKLELNCWSSSLDNVMRQHAKKASSHWFSLYQLMERYLEEESSTSDSAVEPLCLSSVSSTLQAFMESSSLGQFHTRLLMLLSFHCHLLLLPTQPGKESLSSLLWNLHKYYSQFSDCIQTRISQLRQPIEKELKDFVKISKWNDVSFWSIKQSVEKTHRTLFKFLKKFEEALSGPCLPALVEPESHSSNLTLDTLDPNSAEAPIQQFLHSVKSSLPGEGRDLQDVARNNDLHKGVEASSLQERLPSLTKKMRKLCVQLHKMNPAPELAEDLDVFIGEIIRNVQELQSLTVDTSAEKEKQKSDVKHILQQKQRALSDLFKMLTQIGLSYRKGLTWSRTFKPEENLCLQPIELRTTLDAVQNPEPAERKLFPEIIKAWDGCQKYFYRSWARRTVLQTALQHASKELGLGNIERCRGFSSHLFKLLLKQRQNLAKLTHQWVHLRRQTNDIQSVKAHLQRNIQEPGCTLPPQKALQDWVARGQTLAIQCSTILQQLVWLLQCCPVDPQQKEETGGCLQHGLRCLSPLTAQCQPPGCLIRKGDAAWHKLSQHVDAVLKESEGLRMELCVVAQQTSEGELLTWNHFATCCASFDQLGVVVAQMPSMEQLFTPPVGVSNISQQPAITQGLQYVRGQVEAGISDFTKWKTQVVTLQEQNPEEQPDLCTEFSAELEKIINTVLCAVQALMKNAEQKQLHTSEGDRLKSKDGVEEEEESSEDLLKTGHLTQLLEAKLAAEVESLSVGDVVGGLERLLTRLRSLCDSCEPAQLQMVSLVCRLLVRLESLLGIYSDLVRYYLAVCVGAHRSTAKLLSVLASIFTQLAQKGFCLPQDTEAGDDGDGSMNFHDYEGGGIGEGEGTKDVSDKIENEDQVEDTFQEGQEKEEQQQEEKIKAEDNAIEMSEDFDGQAYDRDENEADKDDDTSDGEEQELDKKMGDLGEGHTDTLDEKMWGDDEDEEEEEEEEGCDKEEESGRGMDQTKSELAAKDDSLETADGSEDKDERREEEKKEEINEQGDQREFDENEVDPYHGKQDTRPEPETMDLPEDLNLDQDEARDSGLDEGDEDNPLDIGEQTPAVDEEDGQNNGEEEAAAEMEEVQTDHPGEESAEEPNDEEEENVGDKDGKDTDSVEKNEEEVDEEKNGREAANEDVKIPADEEQKTKEGADPEAELPESSDRKEHHADGQTGEQNIQSDTAVELAGEVAEKDQAKEEHGTGAADASQSEGHESKLTAQVASQSQTEKPTQSFKRKPGRADNKRSIGDHSEQLKKRLRTVEEKEELAPNSRQNDSQQESDLYQHMKEEETVYDTQTYDVASTNQHKAAGAQKDQDEEKTTEDAAMETEKQEEDLEASEVQELKPEQLDSRKVSHKEGADSSEMELQTLEETMEEDKWREGQNSREQQTERTRESTYHTDPELLLIDNVQETEVDREQVRKEMELQLEAWHKLSPGSQEEEAAAAAMWHRYQHLTSALSQQLCEQLRLILEPTQAAKLKGDYRTGKRLNMRKVIPYIASQFRKDKIWLRRTKPSKRDYQICLAIDDSSSMVDNHSKQLAFESLSVIVNALTLLEVGQVSVYRFGEHVQLLHPFYQQFHDESGVRILRLCQFQQKKTRIAQFLETSTKMFLAAQQQIPGSVNPETAQLLLIVSDGRGMFVEGKDRVMAAVRAARSANVFIIFVVLDSPNSRDSVLDIKVPIFKSPGEMPEIRSYMDEFPFPFYIILRDVNALPETLSDALRQWFELVTATD